jgi:4-hydroxy-2-oxoheptanedioate aldolase
MPTFKSKLKTGATLLGTFLQIPAAEVPEIFGLAGFDFGIVDTEHGMLGVDMVLPLLRGCDAMGMATVVRVPGVDHHCITHALDFGTSAVMIPDIRTPEDAARAVAAAKYHPDGDRGVCPFARGARYDASQDLDYYRRANAETGVVLQIEAAGGIANLDAILEVPNIDGIFIGPFDLSQSLGIPGQVTSPRVLEAFREIAKRAEKKGIAVGNFAVTIEQAHRYKDMGIRFLAYATDTMLLTQSCRALRESIIGPA